MNIQTSRQCVLATAKRPQLCVNEGGEYGSQIKLKIVEIKYTVYKGSITYILVCDKY
jgi:hypothetical protein